MGRLKVVIALIFGWLIPGCAHLFIKKWFKAAMFFILLISLVVLGVYFDGEIYSPRIWEENKEHTLGPYLPITANFFTGIFFLVARFTSFANGNITSPDYEIGNAYILTAGFLNLLVLFDFLDYILKYKKKDQVDK